MEPTWLDIYLQALDMQSQMTLPLASLLQPVPYAPEQPIIVNNNAQQPVPSAEQSMQQPVSQVQENQGNLNQMTTAGVPNG